MKKLFCAIISVTLALALTACSADVSSEKAPENTPETTAEAITAPADSDAGISLKIGGKETTISPNGDFEKIMTDLGFDDYTTYESDTCETAGYDCDDFELQIDKEPDESGNFYIKSLFLYWGESLDNGIEIAGIKQGFTADDVIAIYGEYDEIDSPNGETIVNYWGDVTIDGKSCALTVDYEDHVKCISVFFN